MIYVNSLEDHIKAIEKKNIKTKHQKKGSDVKGDIGEIGFAKIVWNKFQSTGYRIVVSTNREDMYDHWDVGISRDNNIHLFDVKNHREDNDMWVEFKNVNGYPGWIYGKAKFISFYMGNNQYLVCSRIDVMNFVKAKIEEKGEDIKAEKPREPYVKYQRSRWGKKDIICRVPIEDLKERGVIW